MIDKTKVAELRERHCLPTIEEWPDILDTLDALFQERDEVIQLLGKERDEFAKKEAEWKANFASQEDYIRLNQGHMLHVMFNDCPECVAFHARLRKESAVVDAARLLAAHNYAWAETADLNEALAALDDGKEK